MEKCTLKTPNGFLAQYRYVFCQLHEAKWAFDRSEYENTTGAIRTTHPSIPNYFQFNTTQYTNHPTEVYAAGGMKTVDHYVAAGAASAMIGVQDVESIGNGDQGSFWNSDAKYGNLYLLTSPGVCQELSPEPDYTSFRFNDFDQAIRQFHFVQYAYNGKSPELSLFGFPKSVSDAKKGTVIVTVLPGPSATHVPDGQEDKPGAMKQGEWPLAWSGVTYTPAKPAVPVTALMPADFQATPDRCSRVVQAHSDSTPILQFTWNVADIMRTGALTVAHDINNYKTVLHDEAAKSMPSVFKITLVRM